MDNWFYTSPESLNSLDLVFITSAAQCNNAKVVLKKKNHFKFVPI